MYNAILYSLIFPSAAPYFVPYSSQIENIVLSKFSYEFLTFNYS